MLARMWYRSPRGPMGYVALGLKSTEVNNVYNLFDLYHLSTYVMSRGSKVCNSFSFTVCFDLHLLYSTYVKLSGSGMFTGVSNANQGRDRRPSDKSN